MTKNRLKPPPIFSFAHQLDPVPRLDCQLGTLCLFYSEHLNQQEELTNEELELLHLSTIFGRGQPSIIEWIRQPDKWTCITADSFNSRHGSCRRERLRWKQRVDFNNQHDQTIKQDF